AAGRPAILEARRDRALAAAEEADVPAALEGVAPRRDVDEACVVEAILRGQRAVEHINAADEAAVEQLAEARDAVGEDDAVDPILNVGVVVAQMERAAGGRVL